ncbi:MAG TPA: acyclic terpene utilization AtuA family protein [bacterium]
MNPLIVGNCSGFYGDRLSAAKELVTGGPLHVLTGDYLAEITMAILYRQKQADAKMGYVGTVLRQLEEVMGTCLDKRIRVVVNAGGLNPRGLAEAVEALAAKLGLHPKVAYVDGDDLMPRLEELRGKGEALLHLDKGVSFEEARVKPVTANAYLGGWGIAEALGRGADIVICPRVTDAALTIGPAAWHHGWARDNWDALAGALAAGHILECGAQTTGGNYSFFREVPSFDRMGYPLAEIHADGSCVITKHPGTGGLVSVGTITAQLLYEIEKPAYVNPDVIGHFDTLRLTQEGPDRVRVSGCKGSPPTATAKVCINTLKGHRNTMGVRLTGLDIEEKAKIVEQTIFNGLGGRDRFDEADVQLLRTDHEDPDHNDKALATLRITVVSQDPKLAGRLFSAKVVEIALANIPGFTLTQAPGEGAPNVVYWPTLVSKREIHETVHLGGESWEVAPVLPGAGAAAPVHPPPADAKPPKGKTTRTALGRIAGTRSGDKGGNANLGVWAQSAEGFAFLREYLTVERLKALLPDVAPYAVDRYELPNLNALNFYIRGILGEGGTSTTRTDAQAKTLGEYLRAKVVDVPASLIKT